ncbi:MAG: anti-sigma factor [Chloroflexota bacterium]
MTSIGHAEAHERLMDLALEPAALDRLARDLTEASERSMDDPFVVHVASCPTCRDVVASWEQTHAIVRQALAGPPGSAATRLADLAEDTPIAAPAGLRSILLERIGGSSGIEAAAQLAGHPDHVTGREDDVTGHQDQVAGREDDVAGHRDEASDVPRTPGSGFVRRSLGFGGPRRRLLPLVAVLGIVAITGGLVINQSTRLDEARRETAALEAVAATVDRVLQDPDHRVVDLRAADGTPAGSISWSSRDFVVLTGALPPPPAGSIYACWIERDGVRSPVGQMWFAGGTAFWTGSLQDWATTSFRGGTFGISLEPVTGPRGNPPVLVGDLGP